MEDDFKSERVLNSRAYHTFLYLFVFVLFAIPGAAFLLENWWLSFGILFFVVSSWVGWFLITPLLFYSIWIWVTEGFSFALISTFFLACSCIGYFFFRVARRKIFGPSQKSSQTKVQMDNKLFQDQSNSPGKERLN